MKTLHWLIVLLLAANLVAPLIRTPVPVQAQTVRQYKVESFISEHVTWQFELEDRLNERACLGWELKQVIFSDKPQNIGVCLRLVYEK